MFKIARSLVLSGLVLAGSATAASATSFYGPLGTIVDSGTTICSAQKPFSQPLTKTIMVEGPGVQLTTGSARYSGVRWTMEFWGKAKGATTWQRIGAWFKMGAPTSVMSTTFTFGIMNVAINPAWTGEIRSKEKIELLDSYGRVLSGGTWGYYDEDQYRTDILAYPGTYKSWLGVCGF